MDNKFAVRYWSRSGNTEKLANKIAKTVECEAKTTESKLEGSVDVLFLGAAIYAGTIDSNVKEFLEELESDKVGKVVVFSTAAKSRNAHSIIEKILNEKGIAVDSNDFYCAGKFLLAHRTKPDAADLAKVEEFAKSYLND
jgi:flavodoxin